jgi:hypothetical protein
LLVGFYNGMNFIYFLNGSFFASLGGLKYLLSSLLWPLHFTWLLEACEKCSPPCYSFPKLTNLFYLCKCLPFLCFSLVLFFLLFGVGFRLSLAPFWGYLNLGLCALVYFIGTFEPSKTRLGRLFTYPLIELFETQ